MSGGKTKASWDVHSTKIFIDLSIEEVRKGSRRSTSFTKQGWDDLTAAFNNKTKRKYNKGQLKNKYDTLRKEWQAWDRLTKETGVGWDHENNTVIADADWWEKKISEVGLYEKFRFKGIQFQHELTSLFASVAATGSGRWAPSSMELPPCGTADEELEEGSGDSDEPLESPTGLSGGFQNVGVNTSSGGSGSNNERGHDNTRSRATATRLGMNHGPMKKNRAAGVKIAAALNRIADANVLDVERAERIDAAKAAEQERAQASSIEAIMTHLNTVPEIRCDSDFFGRCIHLLAYSQAARQTYAVFKDNIDSLLVFLRHECYGSA